MSNHVPQAAIDLHHAQVMAGKERRQNRDLEVRRWRAQKYIANKEAWAKECYEYNKLILSRFFALMFFEATVLLVIRYAFQLMEYYT